MRRVILFLILWVVNVSSIYGDVNKEPNLYDVGKNGKFGYVDEQGKIVINLLYDDAGKFSESKAAVKKGNSWGYIDTEGKAITEFEYEWASPFRQGYAVVEKNDKYGYIKANGELLTPIQFDDAYVFYEERACISIKGKYGFIDVTGKTVIKPQFDGYNINIRDNQMHDKYGFYEGFAPVGIDGKYGFVNKNGELSIPLQYDYCGAFHLGLAQVEKNNKWGFIDHNGNVVIPMMYESVGPFTADGLASVYIEGRYGFINKQGQIVIKPQFELSNNFKEGRAIVCKNGVEYGVIDTKGNFVVDISYKYKINDYSEGLAGVSIEELYGFIDLAGKTVIQPRYNNVFESSFQNGIAAVMMPSEPVDKIYKGEWCLINKKGEIIWDPKKTTKTVATNKTTYAAKANSLTTSSFIDYQSMYTPYRVFDGDPNTAWLEGAKGSGIDENITLVLDKEIAVDEIRFMPGYFDAQWWKANNRIKQLSVEAAGKTYTFDFDDKMEEQAKKLNAAITFNKIKFIVKEVYRSTGDDDTALSEISFYNQGKKVDLDMSGVR